MNSTFLRKVLSQGKSREEVLEQIKKYIVSPTDFLHIVSLNPENMVVALENKPFKEVVISAQIKIIDGVGVAWAARTLGIQAGERIQGVDLMKDLIKLADELRLRVLLIGGSPNLALHLSECYRQLYAQADFKGIEGIKNITNPTISEEKEIFSIVSAYKPHFVFVSFGSPAQELWIARHKEKFAKMVCMGVGGAFDYESGRVVRAPGFLRMLGLEWLFRLILQPWRWRRQLRILAFIKLVIREKYQNAS